MDEIREIERGLEADPENPNLKKRLSSLCARNGRLFDGQTLGDLCEALESGGPEELCETLRALEALGHYAYIAIPQIVQAFGHDDSFVRSAALQALQTIDPGAEESLKDLVGFLGEGPQIEREALIKFLLGSGEKLRDFPGPLIHALETEAHKPVLKSLILAVTMIGPSALPELLKSLKSDQARYPENLIEALRTLGIASPELVEQLLSSLNHKRQKVRLTAARAYASLTGDGERSLTIYNEAILSGTDQAPLAVIFLRELGDLAAKARPTLLDGLKQSGPERIQCAYTLIELGLDLEKAIPVASAGMNELAPFVSLHLERRSAEDALGVGAQVHLLSWIQKPEPRLRAEAFKLLEIAVTQSNKDDSLALIKLLEQDDAELTLGALKILQRIPNQAARYIPELLELRKADRFLRPLLRTLAVIRKYGGETHLAVEFMTACLGHADKEVVASAASSFSGLKNVDRKALDKLFELYLSEDPLIRLSVEPCLIAIVNDRDSFFDQKLVSSEAGERAAAFKMYFRYLERSQINELARQYYFEFVKKGLEDSDKKTRTQAAHILSLYDSEGFEVLRGSVKSESLELRLTALYYLPRCAGFGKDCFALFLSLLGDKNVEVQIAALGGIRLINERVESLRDGVIDSLCQFYPRAGFIKDQVRALISEIVQNCLNYLEYPLKIDGESRKELVRNELRSLNPTCFDDMDRVEAALNKTQP